MSIKKCLQCSSEELIKNEIPFILMEQGYVKVGNIQNGIEVHPTICKQCGFVMLFRSEL